MALMEQKYFFMAVAIVFFIVFGFGLLVSGTSIDIAGCKAEWSEVQKTVGRSDLCTADSCVARPAEQQHNAVVDGLLCACAAAQEKTFSDDISNKRIEEVFKNYFGFDMKVNQVCGSEGEQVLVRRAYG